MEEQRDRLPGCWGTLCERKVCLHVSVCRLVYRYTVVHQTLCCPPAAVPYGAHSRLLVTLVWVTKLARALCERRQIVPVVVPVPPRAESFILDALLVFAVFYPCVRT